MTDLTTWLGIAEQYAQHATDDGDISYDILRECLEQCLSHEDFDAEPDESGLYPFLAKCWPFAQLRLRVHRRIGMWSKQRKDDFLALVRGALPIESHVLDALHHTPTTTDDAVGGLSLHIDARQQLKEDFYNYSIILEYHDFWRDRIKFDTFANIPTLDGAPVDDAIEGDIGLWFGTEYGLSGNMYKIRQKAIHTAASHHAYDPLLDHINSLPAWDGTRRLDAWLIDYCGAKPDQYSGWVGWLCIVQMVARALEPGCMARNVVIFEGPENTGKTQAIHMLGAPWSMTFDMSMDSKEAHMAVVGAWVAELCELDTLRKTAETRLKSFISQTHDTFIPKYSNNRQTYPRRTVFIGSTNEDCYLPSSTGNTRFLPIKTGTFDLAGLAAIRDQLLAEALAILRDTPDIAWWEPPGRVAQDLTRARNRRIAINEYHGPLMAWLDGDNIEDPTCTHRDEITWPAIAEDFLKIQTPERWKDKSLQMQIADALKAGGWWRDDRGGGKKVWVRPQEQDAWQEKYRG